MKTTLEIPDPIFRRAKALAAQRGIPLRALVTEAVAEKLEASLQREEKPWVRLAGGLKHLHKETVRINRIIESEFEKIEPEGWEPSSKSTHSPRWPMMSPRLFASLARLRA